MRRIAVTGGSGFIGTNFVEALWGRPDVALLSLDLEPPKVLDHAAIWRRCDLLDPEQVLTALREFGPTEIVHLGGRTDMFGHALEDYAANHRGTENLIAAIRQLSMVERVVFTSSQFVVGPGKLAESDTDFRPHTIYGESKVQSEWAVRRADLTCIWTMIRPTNIWGRWHPRYPHEFWRVLKEGKYLHPGGARVSRCYGYVGTIVDQILTILESPREVVDHEVFYVGDAPIDLYEWTNAFSLALRGQPVRVVPRAMLRGVALVGDAVIAVGGKFPLFTSRYHSMTESYLTPMEKTFARLGPSKYTLEQGVHETVEWLRASDPFWR